MPSAQQKRIWGQLSRLPVVTESGTSRSITNADANKCVEFTNAGAVTVTVEALESNHPDNKNQSMLLKRVPATGLVTVAAGSGLTLESDNGNFTLATNSKVATIYYLDHGRAIIVGAE
jgi:hypothetical protein